MVDSYQNDSTIGSPLRVDFIGSEMDDGALDGLQRLPALTHVCVFKASIKGTRIVIPLSPNRVQISPRALGSYFADHKDIGTTKVAYLFPTFLKNGLVI